MARRIYYIGECSHCAGTGWSDWNRPDDGTPEELCDHCDGFGDAVRSKTVRGFDATFTASALIAEGVWYKSRAAALDELHRGRLANT